MPDDQELDLQDESTWDSDKAEVRPPSRSKRVVVSVAFTRQDFKKVAEHAESVNMKTSEFIRTSALAKVTKPVETSGIISYSVSNAGLLMHLSTELRSQAIQVVLGMGYSQSSIEAMLKAAKEVEQYLIRGDLPSDKNLCPTGCGRTIEQCSIGNYHC